MKINNISTLNGKNINFESRRTARNAAEQLAKNNSYSLSEPNQRYIENSIKELAKVPGEKNVNFLLDTASKVKYSTNIKLKNAPKHNWKGLLLAAATTAALITPSVLKDKFDKKVDKIRNDKHLTKDEKKILDLREHLLNSVDLKQIKKETVGAARNFQDNLDYFIISSETTTEHKKYVLDRLNYFMSDEYEINPQLKDKKSIAVAEMINDMAIHTPGEEIPNIKAVNQKQHGICAAISIVRKKLAYEDKPNYVDAILSELDSSDVLSVYNRGKLFSKEKIKVHKVPVDFETALANGYRIIDASTMHWMQVAQMSGASSAAFDEYKPFDKENFDVNKDAFYNISFEDPNLEKAQNYYQALRKAESVLGNYKANLLKNKEIKEEKRQNFNKKVSTLSKTAKALDKNIKALDGNLSDNEVQNLSRGILKLERKFSDKIQPGEKFAYIPNEEPEIKKEKIKRYILENSSVKNIPDESLGKILDLVEYFSSLKNQEVSRKSVLSQAQSLYDVAAAFRYQMVKGLEEEKILSGFIHAEGLKDKESILLDTIDQVIDKLENNSKDSDLIIARIKPIFQLKTNSKEESLELLRILKASLQQTLTKDMDLLYEQLLISGGRRGALVNQLENIKNLLLSGDQETSEALKEILGIRKRSEAESAINELKLKIMEGDEAFYIDLFNKLHNTSQIENLANTFNNLAKAMDTEAGKILITKFAEKNGILENLNDDVLNSTLNEIGSKINTESAFFNNLVKTFKVEDENGNIIISADPKDIIIKKWENEKIIIPAKDLKELQEHFTKISKDRSRDEFSTRQGKLHDKSLYHFSSSEKATLKEIKKNINSMFSYIQTQIPIVHRDLKEPLEELKRIIGLQNGNYWVREEGHSGLSSEEQVRILEYMTGKPHYENRDIKSAMDRIKTSPYSGISTSSVYNDAMGWHAQYIVDIKPVKLKTADGKVQEKDTLFHDNSWGASEHENIWVDSNGLTRTDYSDRRGGTLGYITNKEFFNGNLTDRLLNDMVVEEKPDYTKNKTYRKLKHIDNNLYNSPQMTGIIMEGYSPNTKSIASEIHDAMFIPSLSLMGKLENLESELSPEEIKALIKQSDLAAAGWEKTYNALNKRLFSPFENKIQTKEDYDKLADNDYLKVALEKTALHWNYPIQGLEPELAKVRKVNDLSKFRTAQKNRAINSFKYAFSKDINITDYICNEFGDKEYDEIDNIIDKYNLKLTDEEYSSVGSRFEIDSKDFNGSAKETVRLLSDIIRKDLDRVIKNDAAKEEIFNVYKNFFEKTIYFQKNDMFLASVSNIIKFLDREFSPNDDNELVEQYRRIQDMTTEEFKKEILSKATPEDLGMNNYTGYDILKKVRHYDENAENAFMNTVFYDTFYPNYAHEDFKKIYKYKRFSRDGMYLNKYNVSSIYREMLSDLSYLTLHKLFNKYKDRNLTKYGAFPAYPKLEYLDENALGYSYNSFVDSLDYKYRVIKSFQDQLTSYRFADKLEGYMKRVSEDKMLSDYQYKSINTIFKSFILNIDENDSATEDLFNAAVKAAEIPKGKPFKEYKPYIETIVSTIEKLEKTTPKESMEKALDVEKKALSDIIKISAKSLIQERYRNNIISLAHRYIQSLIKYNLEEAEEILNKLYESFSKCHILRNPKELLTAYMMSAAKNSPDEKYKETYKNLLIRGLQYAQLANIQDILMDAVSKGVETSAKDMFKNYKLRNDFGEESLMNSQNILAQMIHKLVIDNEKDTALMFIDKLGLGEDYISYISKTIDFSYLREIIKEAYEISTKFNIFSKKVEGYLNEARENILAAEDYEHLLDITKNKIINESRKYNIYKKNILPLITALDNIKQLSAANPEGDKQILFDGLIREAMQKTAANNASEIDKFNHILIANASTLDLVNQILIKEDSELNKVREILNESFKEVIDYKTTLNNLQQEV